VSSTTVAATVVTIPGSSNCGQLEALAR
jgi:hypothetical protein